MVFQDLEHKCKILSLQCLTAVSGRQARQSVVLLKKLRAFQGKPQIVSQIIVRKMDGWGHSAECSVTKIVNKAEYLREIFQLDGCGTLYRA